MYDKSFYFKVEDMEYIREFLDSLIDRYIIDSYDLTRGEDYCCLTCESEGLFKRYYYYFKCYEISFSLSCRVAF